MSSEVVKKRGRPKKIIAELLEVEVPEVAKKTTRAKSTKAAPKIVKAKPPTTKKTSAVQAELLKPAVKPIAPIEPAKNVAKDASLPETQPAASQQPVPTRTAEPVSKAQDAIKTSKEPKAASPVTTSPILAEVQKLKEKGVAAEATKSGKEANPIVTESAKPSKTTLPPKKSPSPAARPAPSPISKTTKPIPLPSSSRPTPPPPPPPPKPRVPIAALNSAIVSNITTRAGARPNAADSKQLPPNYKSVSRKVTMTIVALPIMIVTSYVLYQRLVLGEERKSLVNSDPAPVAEPSPVVAVPQQDGKE